MNSIELTRKRITAIAEDYSFTATNVKTVMQLDDIDKEFIARFQLCDYQPELLFASEMKHREHHPVAMATLSKLENDSTV